MPFGYTPKKATKLDQVAKRERIKYLRKKVGAGTATSDERQEVKQWDSIPRRGRKPKITVSEQDDTPSPHNPDTVKPDTGERGAGDTSVTGKPEVFSTLPGMDSNTASTLPPLNVDHGNPQQGASGVGNSAQSQSQGPTAGHSAPNASTNGSASNGSAPKMGPQEAEATGQMVASLCTGLLKDLNDYARDKGQLAIGEQFLAMFHFSVKRLTMKHGSAIDEDTMDYSVVCGAAGFVGFNAYRGYKISKEQELWDKSTKADGKVSPQPQPNTGPGEPIKGGMNENVAHVGKGNPTVQSGAIVPFENTGRRGKGFDPTGIF